MRKRVFTKSCTCATGEGWTFVFSLQHSKSDAEGVKMLVDAACFLLLLLSSDLVATSLRASRVKPDPDAAHSVLPSMKISRLNLQTEIHQWHHPRYELAEILIADL
jgi:hypothetical protein